MQEKQWKGIEPLGMERRCGQWYPYGEPVKSCPLIVASVPPISFSYSFFLEIET
jgi:hypothetical protein